MNKKGVYIGSVIFVIMTILLVVATLFSFLTSTSKVEAEVYDVVFLDTAYSQEKEMNYLLLQELENAVIESYDEILLNKEYIGGGIVKTNSEGYVEFRDIESNLDSLFKNKIKNKLHYNSFEVEKKENIFLVSIAGEKIIKNSSKINISYKPILSSEINLNSLGLNSFKEIYEFKEKCIYESSIKEIKNCYNSNRNLISYFDLEIPEKTNYIVMTLTSKKEFLINNQLQKISFSFVPVKS